MEKREFNKLLLIVIFALIVASLADQQKKDYENKTQESKSEPDVENAAVDSKVLSRRKRFLTFPDGSSFQLVFEAQNHGYLQIGDVVWFSNTAALAWVLPSDPTLFHMFKRYEKKDDPLRRADSRHVIFLNEDGKVISSVPYKRKHVIINPAFGKRSVDNQDVLKQSISVKEMHETHKKRNVFDDLDETSIQFHRDGRKNLYDKLETFFEALGWRGKECVLRLLCESKEKKNKQGTFLEEILRATFTLPRGSKTEVTEDYDVAHGSDDCAKLYSKCDNHYGYKLYDEKQ